MSEAQQIIEKNYESLCNDLSIDPNDLESNKEVYESIRYLVYEYMYDFSSAQDNGTDEEELAELKEAYKPNKYEAKWDTLNKYSMSI